MLDTFRSRPWLCGLGTIVAILLTWEFSVRLALINDKLISPASTTLLRFAWDWTQPDFYADFLVTTLRIAAGFLLAVAIAVPLGLAMGYWTLLHRMFSLTVEVVRPIPTTALLPIAAIIVGIGNTMYVSLIFIATAIPILLASVDGVRTVDPILVGSARTLGKSTAVIFRTVLLPAALPHIAVGLRIGVATALLVGISAEMLLSSEGLGHRVVYAQRTFDISGLYAGVLTLATFGFALNRVAMSFETRALRWHSQSKQKLWN
jgi:NitT/TauT family transport system permease protein